jgi:hypothetical protein
VAAFSPVDLLTAAFFLRVAAAFWPVDLLAAAFFLRVAAAFLAVAERCAWVCFAIAAPPRL